MIFLKGILTIQYPVIWQRKLYEMKDKKKNNNLANVIKSGFSDLTKEIIYMSEGEKVIEKPDKIVEIVEKIIEFNDRNQREKGLKILTPNQMLSRLPISLAQLKAENNSENLKMKLGNYCTLCTDQKNLQNHSIKVWLAFFKDVNNFYELQKQWNKWISQI